jgi:hypothetical protein
VQGFPAVAASTLSSGTQTGTCQVSVGITDASTIDATLTLGESKQGGNADPCELSARVADMVVTNLKQKAGS